MTHDIDAIRAAFNAIGDLLDPYGEHDFLHGDRELFQPILARISELAGRETSEETVAQLASDVALDPVLARIDRFRSLFGPRLEVDEAMQIVEAGAPWATLENFLFHPNYVQLAQMEAAGAGLRAGDHVVFLGSGPLPLSCITMCARHGLWCTGIERMPELAELSRRVVRRLGLEERITILQGDHFSLPLDAGADLTMVASAAEPKAEIFTHLARVLAPGAKVSFRIHENGLRRLINSACLRDTPQGFRETARIQPAPPVINTCVFIERI